MNITVNGEKLKIEQTNITVYELMQQLLITDKVMAAAINMEVVKKDNWAKTAIKEDDKVEFLQFVGGG